MPRLAAGAALAAGPTLRANRQKLDGWPRALAAFTREPVADPRRGHLREVSGVVRQRLINLHVRAVFAVLCTRFKLPPYRARPGAPFPWGEEKLRPRRLRRERQLAANAAEQRAAARAYARTMRELVRQREVCLVELAMMDLYDRAADRQGKPDAAGPSPGPGTKAEPALGRAEAGSIRSGSAATPAPPSGVLDPGSMQSPPASRQVDEGGSEDVHGAGTSTAHGPVDIDPDQAPAAGPCEDDRDRDLKAMLPAIEACAPDWREVRSPPASVRERFPLYEMRIGALTEFDSFDLVELLVRLPTEYDDLVGAAPIFENHLLGWFWSEDGAACRAALAQTIEREDARRVLWSDLLDLYPWVVALAPGGSWEAATRE